MAGLGEQVAALAATEAAGMVQAVVAALRSEQAGVLDGIERVAQQGAARIGLAVISGVLDWAARTGAAPAACPECARPARLVAARAKTIRTLLGAVEWRRDYHHCRACRVGFAPLDARLGVVGTSLSPGLARAAALAGSEMPYAKSFDLIATVTGFDLASVSTLARTTRAQGAAARALIAVEQEAASHMPRRVPAVTDTDGMGLCYVLMDGTGAPMLPRECADRPGKGQQGRAGTREVKIGAFFTQSCCDPTSGEPVHDPGSVSYIATFDPAASFAVQVKAEYLRRGFDQIRQPLILGDGAHWIWRIAAEHFPAATQIVDYYHAREHLADLAKLLTPHLGDPATWEADLADHLDLGQTAAIAAAVAALDLPHQAPDLVKPAATEVGYFTTNHHRMQYADFRANGYYIGSGPVESACNTIVKQRAKRAGMHWTIAGLDPVLALRTLRQSHREDLLWPTPQT